MNTVSTSLTIPSILYWLPWYGDLCHAQARCTLRGSINANFIDSLGIYLTKMRPSHNEHFTHRLTSPIKYSESNGEMKRSHWQLPSTEQQGLKSQQDYNYNTHTHTTVLLLLWNMSGTTRVSRYQIGKTRKVKTNLDLLQQEPVSGSGICWAMCKSAPHPRQPRQHPTIQFFTGRMPFLPPNQQRQSTEGTKTTTTR